MKTHYSRRQFLRTAGTAASVMIVGHSFFNAMAGPATPPLVRRNLAGMDPSDPVITSYQSAVMAMQALPASNPLSWTYQAAIHGTTITPPLTAWNSCTHGTYYFWSWHRMYLYWFERIVRKMSGNLSWTLPYWDWTANPQLPVMFRDSTSDLYTTNRHPAMNDGSGSLSPSAVSYTSSFNLTNFTSAGNLFQGTPHGTVHVGVGGWMSSVPTAAQDPIFFPHHCNVDRLWNLWLAQGGGRQDPLNDPVWQGKQFTFFDENGNQVQMTGCDVLRAADQLNYVYEGEPAQILEYCLAPPTNLHVTMMRELFFHPQWPGATLTSVPVTRSIDITPVRPQLADILTNQTEILVLELDGVEAEEQPGIFWEVYLGTTARKNLDSKSPYYVGNVVLFGDGVHSEAHHGAQHMFKPAQFAFPINRAMQAALRSRRNSLPVTFVPRGLLIDGKPSRPLPKAEVKVGDISFTIEKTDGN